MKRLLMVLAVLLLTALPAMAQGASGAGTGSGAGGRRGAAGSTGTGTATGTGANGTGTSSSPGSNGPATTSPGSNGPAANTPGARGSATTPTTSPGTSNGTGGSVGPSGAPRQLSLRQAIDFGLRTNLAVLLSRERTREAKARALEARAPLLPNISGVASESNQTISLAALGFNGSLFPLPGAHFPTAQGPFYTFDARLYLSQTLINLAAVLRAKAGRLAEVLAQMQVRLSTEQVASTIEMAYLNLLRQRRAVEDAQANVAQAQSLLTLAQHQHDAGIATGLDVTRASTRLAEQQVRLSQAHTTERDAEILLARLVGVPMGESVELTDPLTYQPEIAPTAEVAIQLARDERVELQISREQIDIYKVDVRAAHAEHYPTLDVAANFGVAGASPVNVDSVHNVALQLNIPIYNGGLTNARVQEAQSQLRQAELQYSDVQAQVEQDVRQSLAALQTAAQQVDESGRELELSLRELQMARDRFAAGLGDNIEVVSAQTAVANARDTQAAALTTWQSARINLASALGRAEQFHF